MQTEESKQRMKNSIGRAFLVLLAVLLQVIWIVGFAIKLTQYYAYISTAVSVLALIIAMRIYGEHINSAYKFSWIIVIMAFPILGLCLFLLFGREGASLLMKKTALCSGAKFRGNIFQITKLFWTSCGKTIWQLVIRRTIFNTAADIRFIKTQTLPTMAIPQRL